jgi:fructose-1,6-bisphosphatase/inositol monophosphatase family enzyme
MPWDFAAGIVLVCEAGGVLVDAGGNELSLKPGRVRGANSAAVLDELMGVLRAPR